MRAAPAGWTRTGGRGSHGQATPRMADGSPNWSLPAHEPDNSPRAVAGRVVGVGAVYVFGLLLGGAGLWAINQPGVQDAMAALILVMPGPGVVWQSVQAVALPVALTAAGAAYRHHHQHRRRPGRYGRSGPVVRVDVVPAGPDPGIPAGQLVYRRFDSPALAGPPVRPSLPAGRDRGSVEIEALAFGVAPPFILLAAVLNATTGPQQLRPAVFPLVAGAVVLAFMGRHVRRGHARRAAVTDPVATATQVPACESCDRAPGTVTVAFVDGVTFRVCGLCLITGARLPVDRDAGVPAGLPREIRREVRP